MLARRPASKKRHSSDRSNHAKFDSRLRYKRSLLFESLEERCLLSVTAVIMDDVLTVTGSENEDVVEVRKDSGDIVVEFSTFDNGVLVDSGTVSHAASLVKSVTIDGRQGNDSLHANFSAAESNILVELRGGPGTDTLTGGAGNDVLTGGADNDRLEGGGGTDTVDESADVNFSLSDASLVGLGTDVLISIEKARLTGGGGDNILDASNFSGPVILNGEGGADTLTGGSNDDVITGGDGVDIVVASAGNDIVQFADSQDVVDGEDFIKIQGEFLDAWLTNGGEPGALKAPTDNARPGTGGVESQRFEGGLIYDSPNTGLLVIPSHLPIEARSLFDEAYDPVRAELLSRFFFNGFIAESIEANNIKFGDQTKVMGDALLQFSQEATILQDAGFDPSASESVIRILLNAFGQLDDEAEIDLYKRDTPGFFLRDYVDAGVGIEEKYRQGVPSTLVIESDFKKSREAKMASNFGCVDKGDSESCPFTDVAMSADQAAHMLNGWWAVTRFSTDADNIAKAKTQARDVINFLIDDQYDISPIEFNGSSTKIAKQRGGDMKLQAGFLSHMADAVTGDGYFSRFENTINLGFIDNTTIIEGVREVVRTTVDIATAGISVAAREFFDQDPVGDVFNAIKDEVPPQTPINLPVWFTHNVLLTFADLPVVSQFAEVLFTGRISVNQFLPKTVRTAFDRISFDVPSSFDPGGLRCIEKQETPLGDICKEAKFQSPKLQTKTISLSGLLDRISFPVPQLGKVPPFARSLALLMMAHDPDLFRVGSKFEDLAMADHNPGRPGEQPNVWAAMLRPAIQPFENPAPEIVTAAKNIDETAPFDLSDLFKNGPHSGEPNGWSSKNRWETAAADEGTTDEYNGVDFLSLDTLIRSEGLGRSISDSLQAVELVPNANDPSLLDLQVRGTNNADSVSLINVTDNKVEVVINGNSQGVFEPTGEIFVQGNNGDDEIIIVDELGLPINVFGGGNNDIVKLTNGAGTGVTVVGGAGSDTLVGDDRATEWIIDGPGNGTLTDSAIFSDVENLIGGNSADTFLFAAGGSLSGDIDGKEGLDTLDFTVAEPQEIVLSGIGKIDGFESAPSGSTSIGGTFSNINKIIASQFQSDALTGLNDDSTWIVDLAMSKYVDSASGRSLEFSNFDVIFGGASVDVFNILSTGSAFEVHGNSGEDIFTVSWIAGVNNLEEVGEIGGVLTLNGGADNDLFSVRPSTFSTINIDGGSPVLGDPEVPPGDILTVDLTGVGQPSLPRNVDSGTIGSLSHQPIHFASIETLIASDRFEINDNHSQASVLGSEPFTTLRDLSIHSSVDEDWFKITANETGKLIINAFFVDNVGDIDIEVQDSVGNLIADSSTISNNEQIVIPVISQEMYFLRVIGFGDDVNNYELEIENFAVPVPSGIHLDPASDTGMMSNDNLTADDTPRFVIQADLADFEAMDIELDQSPGDPGADVIVEIAGLNTGTFVSGNAARLGSTSLWTFTPAEPLPDDVYFVSAAVEITDGQGAPAVGRSQLSSPLWITIDTSGPKGMVLQAFAAELTGDQEAPPGGPVETLAGGSATLRLSPDNSRLEMTIELAGLDLDGTQTPNDPTDDVTGLHIHRGAPGVNGPVIFGLINPNNDLNGDLVIDAASGRISSAWDLSEGNGTTLAAELANLLAGNLYFNVHTVAHPPGEVRGQILASGGQLQLLQSSDTGMSAIDGVTSKMSPAFLVKGEANAKVRILARNTLTGAVNQVGSGVIGSDATDGVAGNGFGIAEITVEPMADGSYEFFPEFEDSAGNVSRHFDFGAVQVPAIIPDPGSVEVPINVTHLFGSITDLDVKLDITHSFDADLTVELVSPSGTIVTLFSNVGGFADDFMGTILDDAAADPIDAGTAPFTGRFRLEAPASLADFNGEDPNGEWILRVIDGAGDDAGTVDAVHLCIETDGGLPVEIDTLAPNTAFLDLLESSDSGRHNDDNVTNDNTPTVSMTTEDPNSHFHTLFTDNLKFRIFDRFENGSEFLLYNSALDAAVDNTVTPGDGFTALEQILETLPDQFFGLFGANGAVVDAGGFGVLADGFHNLKLEVEDRAGNISHDFLFDLLIDTVAPPVTILRIDPAFTDTGVEGFPETFVDRVTSDTETGFIGRAEANAIVRLYVDATNNNLVNFPGEFALTVAVPLDGDDAFPNGEWRTSFIRDLNDPALFPLDRLREVLVEAEDLAGNVNTVNDGNGDAAQSIDIFIDTQGPQITDVFLTNFPNFDLFLQKGAGLPSISMPTPGVFSLTIDVKDFPARNNDDPNFLYEALLEAVAERAGHFVLRGDTSGVIPILDVEVINDPRFDNTVATASIVLSFSGPLPDDRYTLTISDSIVDPVGNALDGETNTIEPQGIPIFPSGDGQPGGDFNVRFTVDSRPEIGTYAHSGVYLDTNGNLTFDPTNPDFVFRDLASQFGALNDDLFNGNFFDTRNANGGGVANGFDKLAAYGQVNGTFRFLIDFNGNMRVDAGETIVSNRQVNALGIAGDFAPGSPGDEIGLFDGTRWYLDTTGDFSLDTVLTGNLRGFPIVGDFNGDGTDDLATYQADLFRFDITGDANTDDTLAFGFPGVLDRPVAGDYNLDGVDDIGLFVPNRDGVTPGEVAEWFFLLSDRVPDDKDNDNGPLTETAGSGYSNGSAVLPSSLFDLFSPTPLGNDVFAQFGDDLAIPLFGNFDPPPAVATADPAASSGVGLYDAVKGLFMLKDEASGGTAESVFRFGPKNSTWQPVTGDWDGDSDTTVGLFDPAAGKFYLTDTNQAGTADHVFRFGPAGAGWTPITGDWDGDGDTTVGLFNPATGTFYLDNENAAGVADTVFRFGPAGAGWTPIVGDWNNDNVDTVGLFDPAAGKFYLTNTNQAGMADAMFRYGPAGAGWTPLAGDWDGDGDDTVGLFDPAKGGMYLRNENASGIADMNFRYGPAGSGWMPSAGDWQGTVIVLAAEAGVGIPEGLAAFASNASSVGAGSSQAEGPTGILSAVATALASSSSSSSFEAGAREAESTGETGDQSIDDSLDLALAEVADELLSGGLIDPSV